MFVLKLAIIAQAYHKYTAEWEVPIVTVIDSSWSPVAHDQQGLLLYRGGTVNGNSFDFKAADSICRHMWNSSYTASRWTSGIRYEIQNIIDVKLYDAQCSFNGWKNCTHYAERDHGNYYHENDVFMACSLGKRRQSDCLKFGHKLRHIIHIF